MASWERAYLRMATAIAVLLLVGVGLLVSRSGTKVPTTTPAASTSASSTAAKAGGNGGSQAAAPPANAAIGGFQASSGATGSGTVGSRGVGSGRAAGSSNSSSAAIQGAGASSPLPNTGAPFPWWLGLIPLALGILLFAALRRGPAAAKAARSRAVALDTPSYLPPEDPPQSGLGPSEDWCSPADEAGGLDDDSNAEFEGQRPLVGGRVF